jgi:hypothetical protein
MTAIPASVIAAELAQRAELLVRELFPDARPEGRELRWHGRGGAACSMVLRGTKAGIWCNWTDEQEKGDALELVHYTLFPDEAGRRQSIHWAARWLGMDAALSQAEAAALALQARQRAVEALARQAQATEAHRKQIRDRAVGLYLDERRSQPVPLTPELESYFAGRGVPFADLASLPRGLRFTARFYYDAHLVLPAMLAPIIDPGGGGPTPQIAVHVTFLHQGDDGHWRKANVDTAKKSYGPAKGGVIPLLRGRSGRPLRHAPEGDAVLIGEGIENSLAASLCVDGEPRVLAAVSVGNLPRIALPPTIKTVILAYDRDGENQGVFKARNVARQRFKSEGRDVEILQPPVGIKDFSDYLCDPAWRFA